MGSIFQSGFLNRAPGENGSEMLLCCEESGRCSPELGPCSYEACARKSVPESGGCVEVLKCRSCQVECCEGCRDMCHDKDCKAVRCKSCSTMEACVSCADLFCTEKVGGSLGCTVRCTCNKTFCRGCMVKECFRCHVDLCCACARDCSKCSLEFCSACDFLVKCEACHMEQCLICCVPSAPCVGCEQTPSDDRRKESFARLRRAHKGFVTAEAGRCVSREQEPREEDEKSPSGAAVTRSGNAAAAADLVIAAASPEAGAKKKKPRGTNKMPKKNRKKAARLAAAASIATHAAAGAAPLPPSAGSSAETFAPAEWLCSALVEAGNGPDDGRIDHSVIKEWVLSIAARATVATTECMRRYFKGRIETGVIELFMDVCDNNCRDAVIKCAEVIEIFVPQEDKKFGEEKYDDEALTSDSEGANDDLIAGAFAAKERVKIGDFSVGLSAIERKANEAINNDCKNLRYLQSILNDAKGERGLARTRKLLTKRIKSVKAYQARTSGSVVITTPPANPVEDCAFSPQQIPFASSVQLAARNVGEMDHIGNAATDAHFGGLPGYTIAQQVATQSAIARVNGFFFDPCSYAVGLSAFPGASGHGAAVAKAISPPPKLPPREPQRQQLSHQQLAMPASTSSVFVSCAPLVDTHEGPSAAIGRVENTVGGTTPPVFGTVEELLASVHCSHFLPAFLEQAFDVETIALMRDEDFVAMKIPKGPQLKIQNACRKVGPLPGEREDKLADGDRDGSKGDKLCGQCHIQPIQTMFLGCGHETCCLKCGTDLEGKPCPTCGEVIKQAVRFYTS